MISAELEKPITASEKASVTVGVSPILISVSDIVKELTEGVVVSTLYSALCVTASCVREAIFPVESLRVVLVGSSSAFALMLIPSVSFSPA